MKNTKVYILGAGCSVCGDYPIASHVTNRLLDFARLRLARKDSKKLQQCTFDTCRRMMEMGVETIDQLAGSLNDSEPEWILDAKRAMSTYFLSIEDADVERALPNYTAFFEEIFRYGDSELLHQRTISSPCRVITYNYDRLFERAFIEWAKRIEPCNNDMADNLNGFVSKYLNTGFGDPKKIEFEKDRFTLLKFHGGVGQFCRNDDFGFKHPYRPKFGSRILDLIDTNHYNPESYSGDIPLLILPADKGIKNEIRMVIPLMNTWRLLRTKHLSFVDKRWKFKSLAIRSSRLITSVSKP